MIDGSGSDVGMHSLRIPYIEDGMSVLDAALKYAEAGWYVLPVRTGGKHAGSVLGKDWPSKSSRDPKVITAWYAGVESGKYGVALHVGRSGAWVADVDNQAAVPELLKRALGEGAPAIQWTRSDHSRFQAIFTTPVEGAVPVEFGNGYGSLGKGWGDARGKNGIIVVEPSPHASAADGGSYRWERPGGIGAMPGWLAEALPRAGANGTLSASDREVGEWVREHASGDREALMKAPLAAFRDAVAAVTGGKGVRHAAVLDSACWIVRESGAGLYPAEAALNDLRGQFVSAIGGDRDAIAEWREVVRYAVGALGGADLERIRERLGEAPAPIADGVWTGADFEAPAAGSGDVMSDPVTALMAEMLTLDQLKNLPNPEPLIMDWLNMNSECWIIGAPESFKSFVALDMALHVASGLEWQGHATRKGRVVYIAAEGAQGLKLRVDAWERQYGEVSDVWVLPRPVQVGNAGAWDVLVEACRRREPSFIIIDTQARVTAGLDENSVKDMGMLIEAVRRLRAATGACVLVVHHVGRNGGDARGSSAIDGAQDTEIRVERSKGDAKADLTAVVSLDKQKDGDSSKSVPIKMVVHQLGADPVSGRLLSSLVLKPAEAFIAAAAGPKPEWIEHLVGNKLKIVNVIWDHVGEYGQTYAYIYGLVNERYGKMAKGSFSSAFKELRTTETVEQIEGTQRYTLKSLLSDSEGFAHDLERMSRRGSVNSSASMNEK